jgi:HicB family
MRKSTDVVGNKLRIRGALHRRLVQAAKKHGVSLNAEMARRLEESFDQESKRSLDDIAQHMRAMADVAVAATVKLQAAANLSLEAILKTSAEVLPAAWRQEAVAALIAEIEKLPVAQREGLNKELVAARRALGAGAGALDHTAHGEDT